MADFYIQHLLRQLVFLQLFVFILDNGKDEMLPKAYLMKGAALNVEYM